MKHPAPCPHCGASPYRNPVPTVDVVIHDPACGVVIIRRANKPVGYALPGGFIDAGESAETAAVREMREETGLNVELTGLLGVYSRPDRDPRGHTLTVAFTARALFWPGTMPPKPPFFLWMPCPRRWSLTMPKFWRTLRRASKACARWRRCSRPAPSQTGEAADGIRQHGGMPGRP